MSGTIDLSAVDSEDEIVFTFKYAYVKRNSGNDEWLRFYISKDCGETWALRKNLHGDALSNDVQNSNYIPSSNEEWTTVSVTNIYADYFTAGFRYKFQFENDNGNNMYIDDINIYSGSMANLTEIEAIASIDVYPNPTTNETTISVQTNRDELVTIEAYNALGERVDLIYSAHLPAGFHTLLWNTETLATGIYTLRITSGTTVQTSRIVKA